MHRVILWLRNDQRVHDNPVIEWAVKQAKAKFSYVDVVPVFCFDPRFYTAHVKTYDIRKASAIRTKFHIDSVTELRTSLESLNSHLLISDEKPEDFIAKLMRQRQQLHHTIVYQREICE